MIAPRHGVPDGPGRAPTEVRAPWAVRSMLVVLAVAVMIGACASGRPVPPGTPLVPVQAGLVFQFGLGDRACAVPAPGACSATAGEALGGPALRVRLAPFAIEEHEVTNEQYRHCVALGACSRPAEDDTAGIASYYARTDAGGDPTPIERYADFPVVWITHDQAAEYCRFIGRRLPTEFEWERAAGGPARDAATKRVLPFGELGPRDALGDCAREEVNLYGCTGVEAPAAVGTSSGDRVFEDGVPIRDLFGNVHEWTASDGDPLATCDRGQPYTCSDCVACLEATGDANACKLACDAGRCRCGDGGGSCWRVCGRPLCPTYRAAELPVQVESSGADRPWTWSVRGGSFERGSGRDKRRCEGRSDYRGIARRGDEAGEATGFRCAKSL